MAWLYERLGTSGISLSVCHVLAVVLVTVVLSYFALLFGELVPRRIAMQRPEAAERDLQCSRCADGGTASGSMAIVEVCKADLKAASL